MRRCGPAAGRRAFIPWPMFWDWAISEGVSMSEHLLVLVRHGQSEWNLKNLFTGWRDIGLTEQGIAEARAAGRKLKQQGIRFDVAITSALVRAQRTLDLMLEEMGQSNIPMLKDQAL